MTASTALVLDVMRHAKAERADARFPDRERRLRRRGRHAAEAVGGFLARLGDPPELFLASGAPRARETAEIVRAACAPDAPLELRDELYLAPATTLLRAVAALPDNARHVLLVGHQPDLALLVRSLCGTEPTLPTAALARLRIDAETWSALGPASGRLEWLVTPDVLAGIG